MCWTFSPSILLCTSLFPHHASICFSHTCTHSQRSLCAQLPWQARRWLWEVSTKVLQQLQGLVWRASQQAWWCSRLHHQPSNTAHLGKSVTFGSTGPPTPIQNCYKQEVWLYVLPPSHVDVHASFRRRYKSWQSCSGFLLSSDYFHHVFSLHHCFGFSCSVSHTEA